MKKILMVLLASILVTAAYTPASASGKKVKLVLVTTGADANASGKASLALKQASVGQFEIQVRKLAPKATFQVIVDGVHVGDLVTNGGGGGKIRFRSRPRGNDLSLGFDPRGKSIVVRDADGNDVLVADFPVTPPGAPGERRLLRSRRRGARVRGPHRRRVRRAGRLGVERDLVSPESMRRRAARRRRHRVLHSRRPGTGMRGPDAGGVHGAGRHGGPGDLVCVESLCTGAAGPGERRLLRARSRRRRTG